MKRLTTVLVAAIFAPVAVVAASFEGKVAMEMSSGQGETTPMTFSIRPGASRIDISTQGHDVSVILDQTKGEMTILMPERSMYLVRPLPAANPTTPQSSKPDSVQVEKTDVHEKILGYDTVKYTAKTKEGGTTEAWVTDQLGTFLGLGNGGGPMGGGRPNGPGQLIWQDAFRGKDAFPLRVTTKNAQGFQIFRLEAISVEKKSLPDTVFTPPAGFQKLDMQNMMHGMGMPGGMRPPQSGD